MRILLTGSTTKAASESVTEYRNLAFEICQLRLVFAREDESCSRKTSKNWNVIHVSDGLRICPNSNIVTHQTPVSRNTYINKCSK
jgi:hypothetical protein